ncbi:MAG: hypothetical protein GXP63_02510 [DPANN group archaeon]|nr:hypothetical protein [DPANN group archaeon]
MAERRLEGLLSTIHLHNNNPSGDEILYGDAVSDFFDNTDNLLLLEKDVKKAGSERAKDDKNIYAVFDGRVVVVGMYKDSPDTVIHLEAEHYASPRELANMLHTTLRISGKDVDEGFLHRKEMDFYSALPRDEQESALFSLADWKVIDIDYDRGRITENSILCPIIYALTRTVTAPTTLYLVTEGYHDVKSSMVYRADALHPGENALISEAQMITDTVMDYEHILQGDDRSAVIIVPGISCIASNCAQTRYAEFLSLDGRERAYLWERLSLEHSSKGFK